jgi:hypothetical protein
MTSSTGGATLVNVASIAPVSAVVKDRVPDPLAVKTLSNVKLVALSGTVGVTIGSLHADDIEASNSAAFHGVCRLVMGT